MTIEPRRYGRPPVALRDLAERIERLLERELRVASVDLSTVAVKAYWLRAETAGTGYPDYSHAYVWIAPTLMSAALCEQIERLVIPMVGVIATGRGGGPKADEANPLRPFVYAVVDLKTRQP